MVAEFEAVDTAVVAISQEDEELENAVRMAATLRPEARFPLAYDLERAATPAYDRTSAYLIDEEGIVREIFPMIIHARPSYRILLAEARRFAASE